MVSEPLARMTAQMSSGQLKQALKMVDPILLAVGAFVLVYPSVQEELKSARETREAAKGYRIPTESRTPSAPDYRPDYRNGRGPSAATSGGSTITPFANPGVSSDTIFG